MQANIQMKKGWAGLDVLGETVENVLADEMREAEGRPVRPTGTNESAASSASLSSTTPSTRRSFSTTPTPSANYNKNSAVYAELSSELDQSSTINLNLISEVGKQLHPLLCLSVHEHCYLLDYGVWGREEYVKNWWGFVNWHKVEEAYETIKAGSEAR